eukprot:12143691-Alexandrium_andersonii.AAC.1
MSEGVSETGMTPGLARFTCTGVATIGLATGDAGTAGAGERGTGESPTVGMAGARAGDLAIGARAPGTGGN